jgi:hypothetical protein
MRDVARNRMASQKPSTSGFGVFGMAVSKPLVKQSWIC